MIIGTERFKVEIEDVTNRKFFLYENFLLTMDKQVPRILYLPKMKMYVFFVLY